MSDKQRQTDRQTDPRLGLELPRFIFLFLFRFVSCFGSYLDTLLLVSFSFFCFGVFARSSFVRGFFCRLRPQHGLGGGGRFFPSFPVPSSHTIRFQRVFFCLVLVWTEEPANVIGRTNEIAKYGGGGGGGYVGDGRIRNITGPPNKPTKKQENGRPRVGRLKFHPINFDVIQPFAIPLPPSLTNSNSIQHNATPLPLTPTLLVFGRMFLYASLRFRHALPGTDGCLAGVSGGSHVGNRGRFLRL